MDGPLSAAVHNIRKCQRGMFGLEQAVKKTLICCFTSETAFSFCWFTSASELIRHQSVTTKARI